MSVEANSITTETSTDYGSTGVESGVASLGKSTRKVTEGLPSHGTYINS